MLEQVHCNHLPASKATNLVFLPSCLALGLADYSQVDMLDVRNKFVNVKPLTPNHITQMD